MRYLCLLFLVIPLWANEKNDKLSDAHLPMFQKYCFNCHDAETQKGSVNLEDLSFRIHTIQDAEMWQKVLHTMNRGDMPPKKKKQPSKKDKTKFLRDLTKVMVQARKKLYDSGQQKTMRRLNRREYENTLKSLLKIEVDVSDLPDDARLLSSIEGEYDTFGSSLYLSSDQFEQYFKLAKEHLQLVIEDWHRGEHKTKKQIKRREVELEARKKMSKLLNNYYIKPYKRALKWERLTRSDPKKLKDYQFPDEAAAKFAKTNYINWAPYLAYYLSEPKLETGAWLSIDWLGFHGKESIELPKDLKPGHYKLRFKIAVASETNSKRHFVELGTMPTKEEFNVLKVFHISAPLHKPEVIDLDVTIKKDSPRNFYIREKRHSDGLSIHYQHVYNFGRNGIGVDFVHWIDWVEWEGPFQAASKEEFYQNVFAFKKAPKSPTKKDIKTILQQFSKYAFRGKKVNQAFLDQCYQLYNLEKKSKKPFPENLLSPLATILASPEFIYINDFKRESSKKAGSNEIAAKLSYFLWSHPPDQTLKRLAKEKKLYNKRILKRQVKRMLEDPRSFNFIKGFTHQWLHLDRLDFFRFDYKRFQHFDEATREASRQEVFHTLKTFLEENRDIRQFIHSDFVVINGLMAAHYGIPNVKGNHYRKVKLTQPSPRGGLLGMAAIHAMGSNGKETSPVERGAWILRKVLNSPPPPAPPNVPQLSRLKDKKLSKRERIKLHQEEPQCAQCHQKIDPIGFAMENFDASGAWREKEHHQKIDTSGSFYDGTSFKNFYEFRKKVVEKEDEFLKSFIENLYAYALGRKVSFLDEEIIEDLVKKAKKQNGGLSDIISNIVLHREFSK